MRARVRAEAIGFAAVIVMGLAALRFPELPVEKAIWWLVFTVFGAVLLLEICFVSPYDHAQGLIRKHASDLEELDKELGKTRAALDSEKHAQKEQRRKRALAEKLAVVMDEGRELADRFADKEADSLPTAAELDIWWANAYAAFALQPMQSVYVSRFNAARNMSGTVLVNVPLEQSRQYNELMSKVGILEEFIKELRLS